MGFKLKLNRILLLISIFAVLLFSVSLVSASTVDTDNLTIMDDTDMVSNHIDEPIVEISNYEPYSSSNINTEELKSTGNEKNWVINQRNYKMFFDDNNVLKHEYGGQILTFNGEFTDKGVITIDSPDTKITGRNTLFNNTAFNLKADGIMLTNLNFVSNSEFSDNEGACVLVNVTVYNVNIDYTVPKNVTGFGIYSNGLDEDLSNVKLVNNTVKMQGNAINSGYNYGVVLTNTRDAIVSGNTIDCSLPLRAVDWSSDIYGGISMDSVAALAADSCINLRLSNNFIQTNVIDAVQGEPTLDTVLIYACHNSIIEHNTILENDYFCKKGHPNYLYGLDIYLSDNVIVYSNDIHIYTTGGAEAHGTAYPIQVSGPAKNIQIAFNNISSYSNGPNIGIYSQNFYGTTQIDIISNYINITGNADTGDAPPSWALVAGIEVQDSDDKIMNNTIIVNTVKEFKNGQNVYGISYSQGTRGVHTYNIQYNNVSTNSNYAISLKDSPNSVQNSIIANNILKTARTGGNRAAIISQGKGNIIENNTDGSVPVKKMTNDELTDSLKRYLNNPFNGDGISFSWLSNNGNSKFRDDQNHNQLNTGLNGLGKNKLIGNNPKISNSQAQKGTLNSTYYTYGSSNVDIASASSSNSGGRGSESGESIVKSYEVTKKIEIDNINYIHAISIIIFVLILLIIGYQRKKRKEEC